MRPGHPRVQLLLAATAAFQLAAGPCLARGAPGDPWERMNRGFFAIESGLDRTVVGPLAYVYSKLPKLLRKALRNFSRNLGEPVVFANDMLQGHVATAAGTVARFTLNSTAGIGGIADVAKKGGLPHHDNDFGMTLGRAGAHPGPYLFLPLFGPSTVRDVFGSAADIGLDPLTYARFRGRSAIQITTTVVDGIDRRVEAQQELMTVVQTSTDPYATIRSYYLQNREAQIRGKPADNIGELPSFDEPATPAAPLLPGATPPMPQDQTVPAAPASPDVPPPPALPASPPPAESPLPPAQPAPSPALPPQPSPSP
ncbi:MAG: VacJ family lipoprotein [Phenylobacterium sp.]|nr:VacJ family lipoprotein [Phenylobacterium sp.]